MHDIQINLDAHEALHTMKALTDAASKLNYQADALASQETPTADDEAFLARDQAKTLTGVAKQLSSAAWQQGIECPFAFYQGVENEPDMTGQDRCDGSTPIADTPRHEY